MEEVLTTKVSPHIRNTKFSAAVAEWHDEAVVPCLTGLADHRREANRKEQLHSEDGLGDPFEMQDFGAPAYRSIENRHPGQETLLPLGQG